MTDNTKFTPSRELRALIAKAFPDYRGRRFRAVARATVNCRSYWDGGSRTYFTKVRIADGAVLPLPVSHPAFDRVSAEIETVPVQRGCLILAHVISCGQDRGITVYYDPSEMAEARQATIGPLHGLGLLAAGSAT